jgi:hypothetical protein
MPVILVNQEAEIGRMAVQSQPGEKVSEIPSHPVSQVWWLTPVISATWEAINRKSMTEASPRQNTKP